MKFLCVPCDTPMKLENKSSDRGSISLVYACADCGYEFAMLINPMETEVVGSLGVKIGADGSKSVEPSGCPFTGMVQEVTADAPKTDGVPWTTAATARMEQLPEFVAPMVRTGIERFARERGYAEIDEKVLDDARTFFGM